MIKILEGIRMCQLSIWQKKLLVKVSAGSTVILSTELQALQLTLIGNR
jgi:hypothetical protein